MASVKEKKADVSSVIALCQSAGRRANARNVSFFSLYGGQFPFSTLTLVNTKLPAIFSHLRSTTVSLETYPLSCFKYLVLRNAKLPPDIYIYVYSLQEGYGYVIQLKKDICMRFNYSIKVHGEAITNLGNLG